MLVFLDYSQPIFYGPAEGFHLDFHSFNYPSPDAPSSDIYDHRELTPWGKVIPNKDAREQMAEGAQSRHRWDFHHEVAAPGASHGEVRWEPLPFEDKMRVP